MNHYDPRSEEKIAELMGSSCFSRNEVVDALITSNWNVTIARLNLQVKEIGRIFIIINFSLNFQIKNQRP